MDFIDQICLPVYKNLVTLSDHLNPMLAGCERNRENWSRLAGQGQGQGQEEDKEGQSKKEEEK